MWLCHAILWISARSWPVLNNISSSKIVLNCVLAYWINCYRKIFSDISTFTFLNLHPVFIFEVMDNLLSARFIWLSLTSRGFSQGAMLWELTLTLLSSPLMEAKQSTFGLFPPSGLLDSNHLSNAKNANVWSLTKSQTQSTQKVLKSSLCSANMSPAKRNSHSSSPTITLLPHQQPKM